jgi:hypothetical protein
LPLRKAKFSPGDAPRINQALVTAAERLDSKFVVHGNDDSLTPADLAPGCTLLQRVEIAWPAKIASSYPGAVRAHASCARSSAARVSAFVYG